MDGSPLLSRAWPIPLVLLVKSFWGMQNVSHGFSGFDGDFWGEKVQVRAQKDSKVASGKLT